MNRRKICFLTLATLVLFSLWKVPLAQENFSQGPVTITFDPTTGDYIIRYPGAAGIVEVPYELPNHVIPDVISNVTFQPANNVFIFSYTVSNRDGARQAILAIDIQAKEPIVDRTSVTPIVADSEPPHWFLMEPTSADPFYTWLGDSDPQALIFPGGSRSSFSLSSKGLPGILLGRFSGKAGDNSLSFPDEPPQEVDFLLPKINMKPENLGVLKKTVAPDVLPNNLTNDQLLARLIRLKEQAAQLGWINEETAERLDKKLKAVKDELQEGETRTAGNILHSFIHDLQAQHRKDDHDKDHDRDKHTHDDRQNRGKQISDNAFYLLKPNAEFILSKLEQTEKSHDKDEDRDRKQHERR